MKVLLINPWITDFAAYDFWIKPLGLLYVGAFMSARGHDVRLVDCMDRFQDGRGRNIAGKMHIYGTGKFHREIINKPACLEHVPRNFNRYGITVELFRELVLDSPLPDAVLVTCIMTYWYHGAFEAIEYIQNLLPGIPVLLGGIYASLCTDHARTYSGADTVITNSSPSQIIEKVESATGKSGEQPLVPDHFGSWPDPLWDLYGNMPNAMTMTSRGCPMNCTVCASKCLFDGFERRDPLDTAHSILDLAARGVKDCAFVDDALFLDTEQYAAPMFHELVTAGAPVQLHAPNGLHVREITPEIAHLMKRAGMATVRLSLETVSPKRFRDFSGKISREDFIKAADALFKAGFTTRDVGAYILAGLPGQTVDEIQDTIAFVHSCGVPVKPALFSPVPGTVEFERAVKAGMISEDDDPVLQNNTLRTVDIWNGDPNGYNDFMRAVTEVNERLGK